MRLESPHCYYYNPKVVVKVKNEGKGMRFSAFK